MPRLGCDRYVPTGAFIAGYCVSASGEVRPMTDEVRPLGMGNRVSFRRFFMDRESALEEAVIFCRDRGIRNPNLRDESTRARVDIDAMRVAMNSLGNWSTPDPENGASGGHWTVRSASDPQPEVRGYRPELDVPPTSNVGDAMQWGGRRMPIGPTPNYIEPVTPESRGYGYSVPESYATPYTPPANPAAPNGIPSVEEINRWFASPAADVNAVPQIPAQEAARGMQNPAIVRDPNGDYIMVDTETTGLGWTVAPNPDGWMVTPIQSQAENRTRRPYSPPPNIQNIPRPVEEVNQIGSVDDEPVDTRPHVAYDEVAEVAEDMRRWLRANRGRM